MGAALVAECAPMFISALAESRALALGCCPWIVEACDCLLRHLVQDRAYWVHRWTRYWLPVSSRFHANVGRGVSFGHAGCAEATIGCTACMSRTTSAGTPSSATSVSLPEVRKHIAARRGPFSRDAATMTP